MPSDLRKIMKTNAVVRKAGSTRREAVRNRAQLLMEVEQLFKEKRGQDPVGTAFKAAEGDSERLVDELTTNLRRAGLTEQEIESVLYGRQAMEQQGLTYVPKPALEAQLQAHVEGTLTWQQWVERRSKNEQPAPTTVKGWEQTLTKFAEWLGTDYLAGTTKKQATDYKSHLLTINAHSSVKTHLNRLKATFNDALDHGEVKENVWNGLTKKLKDSKKKERIDEAVLKTAHKLAIESQDISFFLQKYTGCRLGEHCGLRWSDVNMQDKTILFVEYQVDIYDRRLKGGEKDERLIPMHDRLYEYLAEMLPEVIDNNDDLPIFPNRWVKFKQVFGSRYSEKFSQAYGFTTHELRANVVSQLMMLNVSPYFLFEITRHTIPGMSAVVSGYTRPSMEELRTTINRLV